MSGGVILGTGVWSLENLHAVLRRTERIWRYAQKRLTKKVGEKWGQSVANHSLLLTIAVSIELKRDGGILAVMPSHELRDAATAQMIVDSR